MTIKLDDARGALPLTLSIDSAVLGVTVLRAPRDAAGLATRGELERLELSQLNRRELLEQVRAGEHVELEVTARTYIQREAPNRNHVRFGKGKLRSIASSGKGTPFLRNHGQHRLEDRGGTITKSKAVKNDAGEWEFHQTIHATKPWAVEGILDGTIDRFSIGWHFEDPITYLHSGEEVERWPKHWPGDVLEDGTVVEWVFNNAELIETSGVNVPAVRGTGIDEFRAALASQFNRPATAGHNGRVERREGQPMRRLLERLGLQAEASEDAALLALDAIIEARDRVSAELATTRTQLTAATEELGELRSSANQIEARTLDQRINQLYTEGRLLRGRDPRDPTQSIPDALEANLRELHRVGGWTLFDQWAGDLPVRAPVNSLSSGGDTDAPIANPGDTGEVVLTAGRHTIVLDVDRRNRMRRMGLKVEDYQRHLDKLHARDVREGRV